MYASMAKRPFTVKMHFNYDEYVLFDAWYNSSGSFASTGCAKGVNSFAFPKIDSTNHLIEKEYRFVAGSAPKYSNPSGKIIECTMQWEEV